MEEDLSEPLLDSAIICAAQKVEHYEIAGYGTLVAWANSIGLSDVAEVFEETLREEKEADEKLTQVGTEILAEASEMEGSAEEGEEGEAETEEQGNGASRKGASSKSGSQQRKAKRRAS
jgi:rubrerythrin